MNKIIIGKVIKGKQNGERLGFRTANLKINADQHESGVFTSETEIDGVKYPGVTHIGPASTFGEDEWLCETYLFNYSGDLYGWGITVKLIKKIRETQKFENAFELQAQIIEDVKIAKAHFGL